MRASWFLTLVQTRDWRSSCLFYGNPSDTGNDVQISNAIKPRLVHTLLATATYIHRNYHDIAFLVNGMMNLTTFGWMRIKIPILIANECKTRQHIKLTTTSGYCQAFRWFCTTEWHIGIAYSTHHSLPSSHLASVDWFVGQGRRRSERMVEIGVTDVT